MYLLSQFLSLGIPHFLLLSSSHGFTLLFTFLEDQGNGYFLIKKFLAEAM
jgi:hypothetical protein